MDLYLYFPKDVWHNYLFQNGISIHDILGWKRVSKHFNEMIENYILRVSKANGGLICEYLHFTKHSVREIKIYYPIRDDKFRIKLNICENKICGLMIGKMILATNVVNILYENEIYDQLYFLSI